MGTEKISNLHIVTDIKVKMSKLIFIVTASTTIITTTTTRIVNITASITDAMPHVDAATADTGDADAAEDMVPESESPESESVQPDTERSNCLISSLNDQFC